LKTKNINNELYDDYNKCHSENISSKNCSEIKYSSPSGVLKKHQEFNIQNKVDDTSIILENFSLSNDLNEVSDQLDIIHPSASRINDKISKHCTNEKQLIHLNIFKEKTFKEDCSTKK